jgi:hypothetical protein
MPPQVNKNIEKNQRRRRREMFDVLYSGNQYYKHDQIESLKVGKTGDCWEITVGLIVPCGTVEVGGCL